MWQQEVGSHDCAIGCLVALEVAAARPQVDLATCRLVLPDASIRRELFVLALKNEPLHISVDEEAMPYAHWQLYPARKNLVRAHSTERRKTVEDAPNQQQTTAMLERVMEMMARQSEAFNKAIALMTSKQSGSMAPIPTQTTPTGKYTIH